MNINPIAIDLGAAHTGVYSAYYPAGSDARDILTWIAGAGWMILSLVWGISGNSLLTNRE